MTSADVLQFHGQIALIKNDRVALRTAHRYFPHLSPQAASYCEATALIFTRLEPETHFVQHPKGTFSTCPIVN